MIVRRLALSLLAGFVLHSTAAAAEMRYVGGTSAAVVQGDYASFGTGATADPSVTRVGSAAYEFILPDLASGGSYVSVAASFTVTDTHGNSFASPSVGTYAGDGYFDAFYDTDRPNTQPSNYVGNLNVFSTGRATVQIAGFNKPLPAGRTPFVGVRLNNSGGRIDVARGDATHAAPSITYGALVPDSGTIDAGPIVEATAIRSGTGSFSLLNQQFDAFNDRAYERADETRRGLIEYHLGGIPAGATVTAASLVVNADGFAGTGAPQVFGYRGDGVADASDALSTLLLGTGAPFAGYVDDQVIALDPALVQSLLADGSILGVTLRAAVDGTTVGYATRDNPFGEAATRLRVTYSFVPEPASLATIASVGVLLAVRRRR